MPAFNEAKFRELVLYIADHCDDQAHYGATKLNKILFFADFFAYRLFGQSITGADYLANQYGPVPKQMDLVQSAMLRAGEIAFRQKRWERRIIALRDPDLNQFSAKEIKVVDLAIEEFRTHTATSASSVTHGFPGWLAAWRESQATGKPVVIPYDSILIESPDLDPLEEARILAMAEKRGWPIKRSVGAQP